MTPQTPQPAGLGWVQDQLLLPLTAALPTAPAWPEPLLSGDVCARPSSCLSSFSYLSSSAQSPALPQTKALFLAPFSASRCELCSPS